METTKVWIKNYSFTKGSEKPLLSFAIKLTQRLICTTSERFFVLYDRPIKIEPYKWPEELASTQ